MLLYLIDLALLLGEKIIWLRSKGFEVLVSSKALSRINAPAGIGTWNKTVGSNELQHLLAVMAPSLTADNLSNTVPMLDLPSGVAEVLSARLAVN